MKLSRKNLGRVATTFLATAMLASLTAVPAMATNNNGGYSEDEANYTFTMTKKLTLPANVYQPNEIFTFTVDGVDPNGEVKDNIKVTRGGDNDIQDATVQFVSSTTRDTEKTITFTIPANTYEDNGVGIYKYKINETDGKDANITYDLGERWLYVYVVNDTNDEIPNCNYKIDGVVVYNAKEEGFPGASDKNEEFTNEYGKKDEQDTLYDLTLKKTVTGSSANLSQKFKFDIRVTATDDNQVFDLVYDTDKNGAYTEGETVEQITANDELAKQVELGNDQQIVIIGLRAGDSYSIAEQGASTAENGNAMTEDGYTVSVTGDATDEDKDGAVTGTVSNADVKVNYENARSASTPTGIAMDIAPYALLVVIAAAGCFVFLRKRNED